MKKICIVGLGYIGLPTASLLATKGYQVHGVDVNEKVVDSLNSGRIIIAEPDLDIMVKSAVGSGNLKASHTPESADIFILAVPTPFKGDHEPDLSYVQMASEAIAPFLVPGNLVILESTSPVCTTECVAEWVCEQNSTVCCARRGVTQKNCVLFAHCPERVLPGQILRELVENDRVVGGVDKASTDAAVEFYQSFVRGKVLATDSRTAEMVKLSENASRDVNIAFANELSLICDDLDVDVWETIELANRHPRVNILQPGPGVGGHCIAVDPWFIVHGSPEQSPLIRTAREVNDGKPLHVIQKVREKASRFRTPCVACLGMAFKANIDDLRESPALQIVEALAQGDEMEILAVEPFIDELPDNLASISTVKLVGLEQAVERCDIIVILVDHDDFAVLRKTSLTEKVVIDTKGFLR